VGSGGFVGGGFDAAAKDSSLADAFGGDSAVGDAAKKDATDDRCLGSDASHCVPPPSQCVNSTRLRYYVNPVCLNGLCTWETREYACNYCTGGGCLGTTTAGGAAP